MHRGGQLGHAQPTVDGGQPAERLGRFGPSARRDVDARRQGPHHHPLEHGEALVPRAGGVETLEQGKLLQQLGCTTGQGWLWCAAISPEEAVASRTFVQAFGAGPAPRVATG